MDKFSFGDEVSVSPSKFEGVVTGRFEYQYGAVQYEVTAAGLSNGKEEKVWAYEGQLTLVNKVGT